MRVLVVTGPPAVGKTTVGRLLAARRGRCAFVDIDDIRHLVIAGHAAPWAGAEGRQQQRLGVLNGCALARGFTAEGIDVVIADVLNLQTARLYRQQLSHPLIVQLRVDYQEAVRRARTRTTYLTEHEFRALHEEQAAFDGADEIVDTTPQSIDAIVGRLSQTWIDAP